jgi:hypothetical protein
MRLFGPPAGKREGGFMTEMPLMPKATAVWLVDNTSLSFEQIAEFCHLHPLEVKAIADGEAAVTIKGLDPVLTGQLSREEIAEGEADKNHKLQLANPKTRVPTPTTKRKGPRYTPVSRRQDRPNAILWLLRNHPELKDAAIMRLVGTTKPTIESIRSRQHWNSTNLTPMDPVTLGLASQIDLDMEVERAAKAGGAPRTVEATGPTLLPAEETTAADALAAAARTRSPREQEQIDADAVFAKLASMKSKPADEEDDTVGE